MCMTKNLNAQVIQLVLAFNPHLPHVWFSDKEQVENIKQVFK